MYLFGWMSFLCFGGLNIIYNVIRDKVIEFINMIVMVCFCIVLKYGVNSFVILFIWKIFVICIVFKNSIVM